MATISLILIGKHGRDCMIRYNKLLHYADLQFIRSKDCNRVSPNTAEIFNKRRRRSSYGIVKPIRNKDPYVVQKYYDYRLKIRLSIKT